MDNIEYIQEQIISKIIEENDKRMEDFFFPYLRELGIKGEITKGKLKWRGVKMLVENGFNSVSYQLIQRGKIITPKFVIDYSGKINN